MNRYPRAAAVTLLAVTMAGTIFADASGRSLPTWVAGVAGGVAGVAAGSIWRRSRRRPTA